MIKSRPSHRNAFRKLFTESLEDRRLMAADMAAPMPATDSHCDVALVADADALSSSLAKSESKVVHFQSEAEAIKSLRQMAADRWDESWRTPWDNYLFMDSREPLVLNLDAADFSVATQNAYLSASAKNLQTAGVDEADNAAFSDDGFAFVLRDQMIRIIDIQDPKNLNEVSRIEYPGVTANMHLVGNKLIVVSQGALPSSSFPESTFYTQLKFFDVSNKDAPTSLGGLNIEGSVSVSRIVNGKLVLVQTTQEAFPQPLWINTDGNALAFWAGRYETKREYLDRVTPQLLESTLFDYQKIDADGKVLSEGVLGDWRDIALAGGKQRTSIISVDLNAESPKLDSMESVLGGWVTNTYVTEDAIYLTHHQSEGVTRITQLDLDNASSSTDPTSQAGVSAVGFGDVQGTVRSSRFMDEYNGYLRVVTSEDGSNSSRRIRNSANVFVLKLIDGQLKTVGSLLDISPGDQAYGAEFDGSRAFVTTGFIDPASFRVIDPLHGIDLSDPTNPKELSDVVIPGITNYVHWVDSNHLLGIGLMEEESRWFTKVSLYDVTDFANPKTLDVWRGTMPILPNFFGSINPLDIHYDEQSKTLTVPQTQSQFFPQPWVWSPLINVPWNGLLIDRVMPIWNPGQPQNLPTTDVIVLSIDVDADDPISFSGFVGEGSGMGRAVVVGDSLVALTTMYLSTYSMDAPTKVVDRILLSNPLRPDFVTIDSSESMTTINVLDNDSRLVDYTITAIKRGEVNGDNLGTVKILPDQTLEYTGPTSIGGESSAWETFIYEVTTNNGDKFETQVSLWRVPNDSLLNPLLGSATISARALDADNKPVDAVAKGDEFWVEVQVQDGRAEGQGVFGAYLDLAFDTRSFEIVGDAEPLSFYTNGIGGEKTDSGWNDLGGFSDSPTPIGSSTQALVRFKLRATADTGFNMSISASNRADSQVTLYGINASIPISNITFGTLQVPQRVKASASIGLMAYDAENKPVASTAKGDEFWVEVTVQDGRQNSQGVYSAYVDLAFDTKAFEIVGEPEALGNFTNKLSGVKTSNGWTALGGFRDSTLPAGTGEQSLVRFKLRATEDAVLNMTASASSKAGSELTLYDIDTIIPIERIKSGSLELPITRLAEKFWDYDVNGDGIVSPIDSLIVINRLNRESVDAAFSTEITASSSNYRLDVNRDEIISLLDVLTLINRINRDSIAPMMNTVDSNSVESIDTKKKK